MKNSLLFAGLLVALFAGTSTVQAEEKAKDSTSGVRCEALPDELKFEAGHLILQRAGDHWQKTKGSAPSKSFVYVADDKRIYEFRYWNSNKYRCWDTGRQASQ